MHGFNNMRTTESVDEYDVIAGAPNDAATTIENEYLYAEYDESTLVEEFEEFLVSCCVEKQVENLL